TGLGYRGHGLGQHRRDGWHDGQLHPAILTYPLAGTGAATGATAPFGYIRPVPTGAGTAARASTVPGTPDRGTRALAQ
ncbi:MAG: hypothetical protein J2P27_17635, partial [Actinobacteria bacterium]|nr:hypothetical protein [Actinomycetota bacterium]